MALTKSARVEALGDLASDTCAVCGKNKKPRQSFCYACYKSLPITMQGGLYESFGGGYEENYHECVAWLREERKARA